MRVPSLLLLATCLVACAKDDDGADDTDVDDTDDTTSGDTDVTDTDPADTEEPVVCLLPDDLGGSEAIAWGPLTDMGDLGKTINATLPGDGPTNAISIELYGQTTTFPASPTPGTYVIGADDGQYSTCGVCVLIAADVDVAGGGAGAYYLATSGTVTLTETVRGVVGTLEDLVFEQVTIEPEVFTSTPVGTCATTLDSAAFEVWFAEGDCTNGVDEDADGTIDCDDPDCSDVCAS